MSRPARRRPTSAGWLSPRSWPDSGSGSLVRGNGWHVFGTLVLVFLILIAGEIVLGLILAALSALLRSGISSIVAGTLVAPFLALVVTLIYYRLSEARGGPGPQPDGAVGGYGYPPA